MWKLSQASTWQSMARVMLNATCSKQRQALLFVLSVCVMIKGAVYSLEDSSYVSCSFPHICLSSAGIQGAKPQAMQSGSIVCLAQHVEGTPKKACKQRH